MTTLSQRLAEGCARELRKELANAEPAPMDGPAFKGSHNCLDNIVRDYDRRRGGHWFDRDAMRFFGTRFPSGFLDLADHGVTLFVSSEKPSYGPRAYCVRAYVWGSAEVVSLCNVASIVTAATADKVRDGVADIMRGAA